MRISDWSSDVCSSDLIGDEAVLFERDVEVDDVAVPDDRAGVGHAVANDMVDRAVQTIGEAILPLARRARGEIDGDQALDQIVDRHRRAAGEVEPVEHFEARGEDRKSTRLNSTN